MFLGALVGGIIGDKTGRRNAFILYEAIHIARWLSVLFTEYGFPYCLPFCDGSWAERIGYAVCWFHRIYAR